MTWISLPAGTRRSMPFRKRMNSWFAVALHALTDHGPLEHVERGEQGGRAMTLVVMMASPVGPGIGRTRMTHGTRVRSRDWVPIRGSHQGPQPLGCMTRPDRWLQSTRRPDRSRKLLPCGGRA